MVRCLCGVLGLVVRQENLHKNPLYEDEEEVQQMSSEETNARSDKRLVVIANHITPFDHFALSLVTPCIKLTCNGEGIPWPLSSVLGVELFNIQGQTLPPSVMGSMPPAQAVRRDDAFISKLKAFLGTPSTTGQPTPLVLFPEDTTTNGNAALLQYQVWCSSVAGTQPSVACITVKRLPPLPLRAAGVLNSTFTQHLLTLFFCPVTIYTVKYLGRVPRLADEGDEEFSKRIQELTAEALGIKTTNYDALEKVEYVKRCLAAQQNQWSVTPSSEALQRPDLLALASQVQEVLPHLPHTAILRDVARTGNVDVTITNFLEGSVPDYNPSSASTDGGSSSPPLDGALQATLGVASNAPINLSTKAATFPTSASDRMYSFQDRKNHLIENALRKYIEKFGLHGENDPYLNQTVDS